MTACARTLDLVESALHHNAGRTRKQVHQALGGHGYSTLSLDSISGALTALTKAGRVRWELGPVKIGNTQARLWFRVPTENPWLPASQAALITEWTGDCD